MSDSQPPTQPPDPLGGPDRSPQQPPQPGPLHPAALAQVLAAAMRPNLPYAGGPIMAPPVGAMAVPIMMPQIQQSQVQLWQGQFPPPDAVKSYEAILPGSFDRMIKMAERLQEAQIEETKRAQDYTAVDARRGQWLGFTASALAVLGAVGLTLSAAVTGHTGLRECW